MGALKGVRRLFNFLLLQEANIIKAGRSFLASTTNLEGLADVSVPPFQTSSRPERNGSEADEGGIKLIVGLCRGPSQS